MRRILLVNDSRFESIIMKDMLNTMGFDVKVSDEYDAIGLVKSFKPDYFIANYIMREIRGDQLIAMVKIESPNIKCYLCSSNSSVAETMRNRRIDGFINTPVEKASLESILFSTHYLENSDYEIIRKKDIDSKTQQKNLCGSCGQKVNKVGEKKFAFCPFCGQKL